MTLPPETHRQLSCLEEARRQTQRQLDIVERQITRRMSALIPSLLPRRTHYRQSRAPDPSAFLEHYRSQLSALTTERQPEIDALSRKLARQDQAIALFLDHHGHVAEINEQIQVIPVSAGALETR
jgi:branched-subunit amino acid aminotransferase/4-amino-4-deoxychorismate lyase